MAKSKSKKSLSTTTTNAGTPRRFYFWRKVLSLSDLNLPRRHKIPIDILRTLSFIPSFIGFVYNSKEALRVPYRDAGGAIILQSSQLDYVVASIWCALAGYWNWILTTSMMRRWIFRYEMSSAVVRLITFIVITWTISAYVNSLNGPDQPIRTWIINCFILLITDIIRLSIISYYRRMKKLKDPSIYLKLSVMRIILYPLSVATCLSVFTVLYQLDKLQYRTSQLMDNSMTFLNNRLDLSTTTSTAAITNVLILIISSWSTESFSRRNMLRKTSLKLLSRTLVASSKDQINVHYRFVIGKVPSAKDHLVKSDAILEESEMYEDLLMVSSSDLKADKSRKVFEAFKWAASITQQQLSFDYIIKAEDDVFVRWDKIVEELQTTIKAAAEEEEELSNLESKNYFWKGLTFRHIPIQYMANTKELETSYGLPIFPTYTHSVFYLFSRSILELILTEHFHEQQRRFIQDDGQNLAIWLSFGFNVPPPQHDRRIQESENVCENDLIAKRIRHITDMKLMYDNIVIKHEPQCTGLEVTECAICYPCLDTQQITWKTLNLACHAQKGITLKPMARFYDLAGRSWDN